MTHPEPIPIACDRCGEVVSETELRECPACHQLVCELCWGTARCCLDCERQEESR